jgi:hypothetical protein
MQQAQLQQMMMVKQAENQVMLQAEQQKSQIAIETKRAEAQIDMQIEQMKAQQAADIEFMLESRRVALQQLTAMAATDSEGGKGKPEETSRSSIDALAESLMQQAAAIQSGMAGIGEGFQMMAQAQMAPKRVLRGLDGRVAGLETEMGMT